MAMLADVPPMRLGRLPDDQAGATRETLKLMRLLVRDGKVAPAVRTLAVELTRDLPSRHRFREIEALFYFVRDRVRFVWDVNEVETLHTAERILKQRCGDCDDKTILLCALLESIGFPTRLTALGFSPGLYSHVLAQVWFCGAWLSLDPSVDSAFPGWSPPRPVEIMTIRNAV